MEKNTSLKELVLWNNKISDEGAKQIGIGLKENTSLNELNLNSNNISDEMKKKLKEIWNKNTKRKESGSISL